MGFRKLHGFLGFVLGMILCFNGVTGVYRHEFACSGYNLELSCTPPDVIYVINATYGQYKDCLDCCEPKVDDCQVSVEEVDETLGDLRKACEGNTSCSWLVISQDLQSWCPVVGMDFIDVYMACSPAGGLPTTVLPPTTVPITTSTMRSTTTKDDDGDDGGSDNTAAIVGGVIGGLIVLAFFVIIIFLVVKNNKAARERAQKMMRKRKKPPKDDRTTEQKDKAEWHDAFTDLAPNGYENQAYYNVDERPASMALTKAKRMSMAAAQGAHISGLDADVSPSKDRAGDEGDGLVPSTGQPKKSGAPKDREATPNGKGALPRSKEVTPIPKVAAPKSKDASSTDKEAKSNVKSATPKSVDTTANGQVATAKGNNVNADGAATPDSKVNEPDRNEGALQAASSAPSENAVVYDNAELTADEPTAPTRAKPPRKKKPKSKKKRTRPPNEAATGGADGTEENSPKQDEQSAYMSLDKAGAEESSYTTLQSPKEPEGDQEEKDKDYENVEMNELNSS